MREPAIPSGTVVFLFSDIEGSTARWDRRRDAMQAALRRHDALVRSAIERYDGYVFKTVGDAFCATFATVDAALRAASDAQRELAEQDWSEVGGLRVRMAIHVGDADERDGDYFGPTVNRVARLLALGHGGQVLVSGVAMQLAGSAADTDLGWLELGTFGLKDLREPEHVFQLTAPGLPREFKALVGAAEKPGNLPRATTTFVGRRQDAERLAELLRAGGLVTLVGTGGVGKTRLAIHSAERVDGVPDGTWLVELAPLSAPALVAATVLSAIEGTPGDSVSALEALLAYLRSRRLLLVLDNCEHLVGEVARVAAAIVAQCPHVTILATSREPLGVSGEKSYRLASLDIPAALELFADRARSVNPHFLVSAENRASVESICRRLDGIALAIELAAARLRVISVDELSRRLTERFRILTGGSRSALPRQQTMRALIDWSYDTLLDDEKAVFRRLAVFLGGWSLDAASAVSATEALDPLDVLDLLGSLVDKSLVVAAVEGATQRYSLLQSIQDYAGERLDQHEERAATAERHARHFASVAERAYREWETAPRPGWLAGLSPDLDNFRSALGWCLADRNDVSLGARLAADIAPAMMRFAPPSEAIRWCEAALAESRPSAADLQARLHYALSMLYNNQGTFKKALAAAESAVQLYSRLDDDRASVRAYSQVAQQYAKQSRHDEAMEYATRALDAARRSGDQRLLAATLQRCASVFKPSEIERARPQFQECVALFRALGRVEDTSRALMFWAVAESEGGCFDKGIEVSQAALALDVEETRLYLTNNLACGGVASQRDAIALPAARDTLAMALSSGHATIAANAVVYLATLSIAVDPERSAKLLGYGAARRVALGYEIEDVDRIIDRRAMAALTEQFDTVELQALLGAGAAWTEDEATRVAAAV